MCTMGDVMMNNKPTTTKPLTRHKDSRIISKIKPKIRIIHIFAPEIIKTDVANFRELVQRLTGKPPEKKRRKERSSNLSQAQSQSQFQSESQSGAGLREKIKGEEEIWVGANSGGGFLGGFGDLDGFMQELNHHHHHHHHGFTPVIQNLDAPSLVNSHLEYGFGERSLNLSTYT